MQKCAKTESKCLRKLLLSKFEATSVDSKEAHDCCVIIQNANASDKGAKLNCLK